MNRPPVFIRSGTDEPSPCLAPVFHMKLYHKCKAISLKIRSRTDEPSPCLPPVFLKRIRFSYFINIEQEEQCQIVWTYVVSIWYTIGVVKTLFKGGI
ncbi:MAG: hypothetical protein FWE83_08605 [Oscillospiraceae bacterium]|nr:hypothetical protein [Oscillospiraceae bacterium]